MVVMVLLRVVSGSVLRNYDETAVPTESPMKGEAKQRQSYLYAGEYLWMQQGASCMRFYEKPTVDDDDVRRETSPTVHACQRLCDATAEFDCECVHYFDATNHCYLFNQSECVSARKFNSSRWAELLGKNSAWGRVAITSTVSISVTQSLDNQDTDSPSTSAPDESESDSGSDGPHRVFKSNVQVSTKSPSILLSPIHALYLMLPLMVLISLLFLYQHLNHKRQEKALIQKREDEKNLSSKPLVQSDCEMLKIDESRRADYVEVKRPPSDWQRGKMLGRGSFGKVFIALCPDGAMLAVKAIELGQNLTPSQLKMVTKEIKVLSELDHYSIVTCIGCRFDPVLSELHIFMEYMPGGSLGQLVRKLGTPLRESTAASYIRQTLEGVAYMHNKGIVHRDLKGDNILLSATGTVKLADFGASSYLHSEVGCLSGDANVGTPLWMAPEVIAKTSQPTPASDVWAVGIVTCEVLNQGKTPWAQFDNNMQALYHIARWKLPLPGPNLPTSLSPVCYTFLEECHRLEPTKRLLAKALLNHSWLASARDSVVSPPSPSPLIERSEDLQELYKSNLESSGRTRSGSNVTDSAHIAQNGSLHSLGGANDFATVSLVSSPEDATHSLSTYEGSRIITPPPSEPSNTACIKPDQVDLAVSDDLTE